jgi:RimJ/RimL family protein N-acetyltransferase
MFITKLARTNHGQVDRVFENQATRILAVLVVIREARVEDAKELIAHITAIADDPISEVLLWPGEFQLSLEQERQWITTSLEAEHSTVLVAEVTEDDRAGNKIVGVLSCAGGEHRGNHHTTTLGITIHKDWRNQGIGRKLMEQAIAWAKGTGVIKRIQLGVTATNAAAIHLYEKLGFKKEGLRRRGMFKNGRFYDTWLMGLLVD